MLPFIRLGPFLLQLPGLVLLVGVWIGSALAEKEAERLKLSPADVYNLIFYGLVAGLIGARLAYAAQYLSAYLANPLSLFALTPATLSPNGGLVIGAAIATLFGWRKKMALRRTLDALAPGLAAFMIAFGVAHFLSGDAFGSSTKLPWAIYLWDDYRHPSQVYETLAALAAFAIVWKRPVDKPGDGVNFLLLVSLSAAARVFLEAFRGDSVIWLGGFRAAQVIGLLALAASLWLMRVWAQRESQSAQML
ncbi:MAG: prolipoprotein diacylglyceryl transferase [Chloroflexi bacterium]|nr:prolipoprotein diacylglyceryl transferase [Chloroflexota bacterium]